MDGKAEADSVESLEGLRFLARIISRSWAARHLARAEAAHKPEIRRVEEKNSHELTRSASA